MPSLPFTPPLRLRYLCVFALIAIALGATNPGCSSSSVVPVSGRVTLDGNPLPGVHIGFQPIAKKGDQNPGSGSYALTDSDGQYTLLLVEGEKPGAVVGNHRVEIIARSEIPANIDVPKRPPPKIFVPAKYNQQSELTFEVPAGGTAAANFDLKFK